MRFSPSLSAPHHSKHAPSIRVYVHFYTATAVSALTDHHLDAFTCARVRAYIYYYYYYTYIAACIAGPPYIITPPLLYIICYPTGNEMVFFPAPRTKDPFGPARNAV